MNVAQKSFQLAQIGVRRLATTSVKPATCPTPQNVHPGLKKLRAKMEKFQCEDGVPIHLKGGVLDKILYQATLVLALLGIGMTAHLVFRMTYPKREE